VRFFYPLILLAVFFVGGVAYAAAWLQEQGKGQMIHSVYHYSADKFLDVDGNKLDQTSFFKLEDNIYIEYGLREDITLGLNPSIQMMEQGAEYTWGLADTEIFARKKMWQNDASVFSIQPLIKIPGPYNKDRNLKLGNKQVDLELRTLFGHGFSIKDKDLFSNFELAYRYRAGEPGNQIKFDATIGLKQNDNLMFVLQSFNSLAVTSPEVNSFNSVNSTDYDLSKIQISAVSKISPDKSVQLGVFKDVWGKNTGSGGGILLSLWSSF